MNFGVALCHVVFLRSPGWLPRPLPPWLGYPDAAPQRSFLIFTRQRIRGTAGPLSRRRWGTANVERRINHRSNARPDDAIAGGARCDVTWLSPCSHPPRGARRRQAGSRCENCGLPVAVQID